jgi:hypothetical protein
LVSDVPVGIALSGIALDYNLFALKGTTLLLAYHRRVALVESLAAMMD